MTTKYLALLLLLALPACDGLTLGDQYMEGSVRGTITDPAGMGVEGVPVAVHRTSGCPTCLSELVSSGASSTSGIYSLLISVPTGQAETATFALVVTPAAATGLAGDTVPFDPDLGPNGAPSVTLHVQLIARP